jgi:hypothetical protein
VATIPNAGGARYAPRGMVRALLRFAVLAGLVTAGWLLGAGVSHATENLGQPGTGMGRLASDPIDIVASSDGDSSPEPGLPSMVRSSLHSVLSHSVPRLPVQPVDLLKPVVRAVAVPRPLSHVVATVSRPMSAPTPHDAGVGSQQPVHELAAVPPFAPVVRAAVATVPAPATSSAPAVARHAQSHGAACTPASPAAPALTPDVVALDGHPTSPIPTSPPDSSTAPCTIGNASGGGGVKGSPDLAVTENGTNAGLASMHGLRSLSGADLPRSAAEQPSTSPD